MINREYIKSQIDILPEDVIVIIDKLISRRDNRKQEIMDTAFKDLAGEKKIAFELEELLAMETATHEETLEIVEKARLRGI